MKTIPTCILFSNDKKLINRLSRISTSIAVLHSVSTQLELDQWFNQFGDTVLLADLRAPDCLNALAAIRKNQTQTVIIALGAIRSDPMLAVELLEPFSQISLAPERREFQTLLKQSIECLILRKKTRALQNELITLSARQHQPKPEIRTPYSTPLHNFSKALKYFDNLELFFESVVEGLVATTRVSRAGIFTRSKTHQNFTFQAGIHCLASTKKLTIPPNTPFIQWMEMHPHLISRQTLTNIPDLTERTMLCEMLNSLGAEMITPLFANDTIKGWIFVSQRSTGIPFDITDLDDFTGLTNHISASLERALQYEKTTHQNFVSETVFNTLPIGIVACDENGIILEFNSSAKEILNPINIELIGSKIEILGSRIADMLHRTIEQQKDRGIQKWTNNRTMVTLAAETRCLKEAGSCVGAMIMLHNNADKKQLKEKTNPPCFPLPPTNNADTTHPNLAKLTSWTRIKL